MKTVCSQTGWRLWLPLVEAVQQVKREKNMVNSVQCQTEGVKLEAFRSKSPEIKHVMNKDKDNTKHLQYVNKELTNLGKNTVQIKKDQAKDNL